jgi:hypothetical protein
MKVEIQASGAQFLEKIAQEAEAEGQSLSDLEKRCLAAAFQPEHEKALKQIEQEFPSPEAYSEFIARVRGLIERAVVKEAESRPEMTPQARALLEKLVSGKGEAVVGSLISLALFGRAPVVVRALGTAMALVPLAAVATWVLYPILASGQLSSTNKFFVELFLALVIVAAVSSVLRLVRKASER